MRSKVPSWWQAGVFIVSRPHKNHIHVWSCDCCGHPRQKDIDVAQFVADESDFAGNPHVGVTRCIEGVEAEFAERAYQRWANQVESN